MSFRGGLKAVQLSLVHGRLPIQNFRELGIRGRFVLGVPRHYWPWLRFGVHAGRDTLEADHDIIYVLIPNVLERAVPVESLLKTGGLIHRAERAAIGRRSRH